MFRATSNSASQSAHSFSAWPGRSLHRIGIWLCGEAHEALTARHLVSRLAAIHPQASILVFGSRDTLAFFEMDSRIAAYLPLAALEPPRPAQTRLARYLENRAQFKKLQQLNLDACVAVLPHRDHGRERHSSATRLWSQFVRSVNVESTLAVAIESGATPPTHASDMVLHPGPQAIEYANRIYHLAPPRCVKVLIYLGKASDSTADLKQRDLKARQWIEQNRTALLGAMGQELFITTLVNSTGHRLNRRKVFENLPGASLVNWNQLIGHLAYADWVLPVNGDITSIAVEMGREAAVFAF